MFQRPDCAGTSGPALVGSPPVHFGDKEALTLADKDDITGLSVFDEALGSIQTTAKWIVGAAAVVIGTLIGGLQLKDLGPLLGASQLQLAIATAACLAAIFGAGWILVMAARVLITQGLTLSDIARREVRIRVTKGQLGPGKQVSDFDPLLGWLARRRGDLLPQGIPDVLTFKNAYDAAAAADAKARSGAPALFTGVGGLDIDGDTIERLKAQAQAQAEDYRARAERLVDAAQFYMAQRAFRRLIQTLWMGGILVVVGVVAFVLLTAHTSAALVTTPTQVRVLISARASHADLVAAGLAQQCAGRTLTGIAVGGDYAEPLVVTNPAPSCPARQFKVTKALGLAIPVPPKPEATAGPSTPGPSQKAK